MGCAAAVFDDLRFDTRNVGDLMTGQFTPFPHTSCPRCRPSMSRGALIKLPTPSLARGSPQFLAVSYG
jgi:hypothetical protein